MKKLKIFTDKIKNLTPNKVLDAIFVFIIFVLLFVPMMKIDMKGKKLYRENRMMAKWVPLISETWDFNYNFGKDFESWYKDRFFLRNYIVSTFMDFKYKIAVCCYCVNRTFINQRTNYMDNVTYFYVPDETAFIQDMSEDNKQIISNLQRLEKFCNEHNIKLYIMIAPSKNEIGSDLSYPILHQNKSYLKTIGRIIDIKKSSGIEILYPYYELLHASTNNGLIFFKSDYHWTDVGANIAYKNFMKAVKKDFADIKISEIKDFDTFKSKLVRVCPVYGFFEGRFYNELNLDDEKVLDTEYTYLVPPHKENIYETHTSFYKESYIKNYYINKNNSKAPNLFMFGDSYSLSLLPSLVSSFQTTESIFVWASEDYELKYRFIISNFEQQILDANTDVLFLLFCDINRLKYLYNDKKY